MSKWTRVLVSAGLVSLPAAVRADDASQTNAPAPPPPTVLTALSSTTLSGYIDTSAVWKFGTGNANMPGRVYDGSDVQDGFNLNVVSLTLNKPLDDSQWAAGYNVQMLMGPGAHKRGTGLLASASTTEFAFNEAYVNLRVPIGNGIELHIGQFGTYNGYEAYDTYKNPNWSRSYGFYIESSAHTGISAIYKVNDIITLMAGVGNEAGFNNQVDAKATSESRKAYLAMVTLTAPESMGFLKGATLSGGYTVGESLEATAGGGVGPWSQGNIYVGASIPTPMTGLTLGVAYDYTYGGPAAGTVEDRASYSHALAAYMSYQVTEKLNMNWRADWAEGSNGTFGYLNPSGDSDELFSLTATTGYSLWKNVMSRIEFRWDHGLSAGRPFGGTVADPLAAAGMGRTRNAESLTANVIYMF